MYPEKECNPLPMYFVASARARVGRRAAHSKARDSQPQTHDWALWADHLSLPCLLKGATSILEYRLNGKFLVVIVGDAPVKQTGVQLVVARYRSRGVKNRSRTSPTWFST